MEIKELGEFGLIQRLAEQFSSHHPRVVQGIGDDASVTIQDPNSYLLCTTDTLVEDVHFSQKYTPPYNLGKKAVSISLSDIAAMGGAPLFLLTSIILPATTSLEFINLLYRGMQERAKEFGVALVGGNTSSSPDRIIINTTLLGEVRKEKVVLRKGASVGDALCVTGYIGDSAFGLKMLKEKEDEIIHDQSLQYAILRHIDPLPRVQEGMKLAEKGLATSMIDMSDGLLLDLRHLAEESKVGAKIWEKDIPLSAGLKAWIGNHPRDIALALSGGEDYELLFTVSKENMPRVDALSKELSLPLTRIGEIVPEEEGITVWDEKGKALKLKKEGFEHFV